jgi:uncharacterized membrane protein YhhN
VTTHVWVLSVALTVTALLSWGALLRGDYDLERVTRPTFVVLVLGLAWSLATEGPARDPSVTWPLFAGLGLSLVGELFLLTATTVRFRLGLVVLLFAHGAYVWAVLGLPGRVGLPWAVLPVAVALLILHGRVGRLVVRHSGRDRGLVLLSLTVLMALAVIAAAKGDWTVLVAVGLLLVADLVLGHDRFVRERRLAPVTALATHQVAQALLVLGLLL